MSCSTESFQGQGSAPKRRARRGCFPSKPSRHRQEKQEGRGSRLSTSPSLLAPSCENPRNSPTSSCFWTETLPPASTARMPTPPPALQQGGRKGMASLPCNTDPLYKVPLNLDPQKGPDLGLIYTSRSGGAVLPTAVALLCSQESSTRPTEPSHGRNPSNAGYAVSSSLPPKGQVSIKTRSRDQPGPRHSPFKPQLPGRRGETGLQELPLLVAPSLPAPSPAQAVTGGFQDALPLGTPPLSGRVLPHFIAGSFFLSFSKQRQSPVSSLG